MFLPRPRAQVTGHGLWACQGRGDPSDLRTVAWVHDNVEYEVYNGSLKGARGTLLERRGNDIDQASLLIALLRYHQLPARYQVGTVEVDPALATQVTGTLKFMKSICCAASFVVFAKMLAPPKPLCWKTITS